LASVVVGEIAACPRRHTIRPESDLAIVAQTVSVLGAVEYRRCRMVGKHVQDLAVH
jgi:hypothetical protein